MVLVALLLVGLASAPWSLPIELWGAGRLTAYVGSQRLELVRNPGNGMVGIDGLGTLDGMLFELTTPAEPGFAAFHMLGVSMPLEIASFAPSGELLEIQRMEPCPAEPCPLYAPSQTFLWAIETVPGVLKAAPGDLLVLP